MAAMVHPGTAMPGTAVGPGGMGGPGAGIQDGRWTATLYGWLRQGQFAAVIEALQPILEVGGRGPAPAPAPAPSPPPPFHPPPSQIPSSTRRRAGADAGA